MRGENTKDKAGALPPAVQSEEKLRFSKENTVSSANTVPHCVVRIQLAVLLYEWGITEVFEDHREVQIYKYKTDSVEEGSDFEDHPELVKRA